MKLLWVTISIIILFSYQNCSLEPVHEGEIEFSSSIPGEASLEIDPVLEKAALAVLQNRCIQCHNGSYSEFGINLEGDTLDLLGRKSIVIGLPEGSILYKTVVAESRQASGVSPMPTDGRLSEEEKEAIRVWIADGIKYKAAEGEEPEPEYYYESNIVPIIEKYNCLSCHSSNSNNSAAQGGYILLDTYDDLMKFVAIGNEDSLLLSSLKQGRMPKNADPISDEDLDIITSWVLKGALTDADKPEDPIEEAPEASQ